MTQLMIFGGRLNSQSFHRYWQKQCRRN